MTLAYRFRSDFFRTVTAIAVLLGPSLSTRAQTADGADDKLRRAVQTPQSVAAIRLAPRAVLTAPELQMMPIEVATAAGLEYVGVDPVEIELIEAVIEPPLGATMYYGAAIRFASPFDLERLAPQVWEHCEATDDGEGVRYDSRDPNAPSFAMANERTLLVASPGMLKKLMKRPRPEAEGPFAEWLDGLDRSKDLHAAVNFEAVRPFLQLAIAAAGDEFPEEARRYLPLLEDVCFLEATLGFRTGSPWQIALVASNPAGADRLQGALDGAIAEFQTQAREGAAAALASEDPMERAVGAWQQRVSGSLFQELLPKRDGTRFSYTAPDYTVEALHSELYVWTAIGGVLLLPAVQAAREAARKTQSMNNMKRLVQSWRDYESVRGKFPTQAVTSTEGDRLLSWRVAVLPQLGEEDLYREFRFDEPWDSPHNSALIPRMPVVFLDPSSDLGESDGKTHYLGVVGAKSVLNEQSYRNKMDYIQNKDGLTNTLAIVQVDDEHAVTWTRPVDYDVEAHEADPIGGIGSIHPGVFLGAMCDGSVRSIPLDTDPDTLRALMTVNGRERVTLP